MKRDGTGRRIFLRSILVGMLVLSFLGRAEALSVRLTPSVGSGITVEDNDPNDYDTVVGSLVFLVPVGEFVVQVTAALSKPVVGGPNSAELALSSVAKTGGIGGVLTIEATDTGYGVGFSPSGLLLTSLIGGTTDLGLTTYQSYVDAENMPFGTSGAGVSTSGLQGPFSGAFDSTVTLTFPQSAPFSMTAVAQYVMGPNQIQSIGANTIVTPLELCTASIGDFVWHDLNRNGIQDPGEFGLNGVEMTLKDALNNILATATTGNGPGGQSGYYQFSGLCAGSYVVEAATPAGFYPTTSNVGSDRTVDSNGSPASVTLSANDSSNQTIDFGFDSPCTGMIGDFLWHDQNRDGLQNLSEPGLDGLTVNLLDVNNTVLATTTTGAGPGGQQGYYQFAGLCAGDYQVEAVTPQGFDPTDNCSADQTVGDDSNCSPAPVTLSTDSATNETIDFGFTSPCTGAIGDFLWHDQDRNGLQDLDETGMDGLTVNLLDANNTVLATTTTGIGPGGQHGYYQFAGLCGGDYQVEVIKPLGFEPTAPCSADQMAGDDSNCSPAPVTLPTDSATNETIDFGFLSPCTGTIGDYIWNDLNLDGLQELGEPGLNGVTVLLKDANETVIATTTTILGPDGDGYYQFTGLCMGSYRVAVTPPAGFLATVPCSYDPDITDDNNCNPMPITLPGDDTANPTIDFGFFVPRPAITVTEECTDAPAPGQPMPISGTVKNTGNEPLDGVVCTDSHGVVLSVTSTLAVGASASFSGSYIPSESPSTDSVTCSANGAISSMPVSDTASATCKILTTPAIDVTESCSDAPAPGQPMPISGTVTNTGNETLNGVVCTDSHGVILIVPGTLAAGASASFSGSYTPSESPSTDSVTCSASGAISSAPVSDTASATCKILTAPAITVMKTCTDASAPGTPITFTATVTNTGNEPLYVTCTDELASPLTGVPTTLAPGAFATVTGSYIPSSSPSTGTLSCSGKGTISQTTVTGSDSATCKIDNPAIDIEKYTNGQDADVPTGPIIPVGGVVTWTYVVTNTGNVDLSNVAVTDDKIGAITCPKTALVVGESMTCTKTGTAVAGQYTNMGTVKGMYGTTQVTDMDPSNYFGQTSTTCTYTQGYWKTHSKYGPAKYDAAWANIGEDTLFFGYGKTWHQTITAVPKDGDAYLILAHQYIAAYLNKLSGADTSMIVDALVQAEYLLGAYDGTPYAPSMITGAVREDFITTAFVLDEYNNGLIGPGHCDTTEVRATIGDLVWNDTDKDGVQDTGEAGISGVTVNLYDCAGNFVATTSTNRSGIYSFTVAPGEYKLGFILKDGYLFSPKDAGLDTKDSDANLSTGFTVCTDLTPSETDLSWDTGMYPKSSTNAKIGDLVWNDKDKDGIQDKGEEGIAGVVVTLYACNNGNPTTNVQETLTVSGRYSFAVAPGNYAVQFSAPLGWSFSPKDKTGDTADSDANVTTGMTICTNLTSGETDLTWDAGLYEVPVGCTYTQGYWKTHSKYGPARADSGWMNLEDTKFLSTTKTWYQILWAEPSKGQYYLTLAHQYIAAYLNGKNGASTTAVKTQMDRAYYLLNTYGANLNNIPATLQAEFQSLAQTLDKYNNGLIGPGHCGNEVDYLALP